MQLRTNPGSARKPPDGMNSYSADIDYKNTRPLCRGDDRSLWILFATVTGNAERVALRAAVVAERRGFQVRVEDMGRCDADIFRRARQVLFVISTTGDGEPPEDAVRFWQSVVRGSGMDLRGLKFSVLALGNLTYDHFCQCGRDFDAALERHGATRIYPRMDCDCDFEAPATQWLDGVLAQLTNDEQKTLSA